MARELQENDVEKVAARVVELLQGDQEQAKFAIYADNKRIDDQSMTFREERALIAVLRDITEDEEASITTASMHEFALALVVVVKRREDPEYGIEQALDLDINDVVREDKPEKKAKTNGGRRRPTAAKSS